MAFWISRDDLQLNKAWVKRFDPSFWTIDFPRPMMAALTTDTPGRIRLNCLFYRRSDLCGLIWESVDRHSHPLLKLETSRDYRNCILSFDWIGSDLLMPLDAVNGATLTVEARDRQGTVGTWYIRLWNFASGTPSRARITLDFDNLRDGFSPAPEQSPIWTGDIDRMFISIVPREFDGTGASLPAPANVELVIENLTCQGSGSTLAAGDAFLPEHRLRMCTSYDDSYHIAPSRMFHQIVRLGYRVVVNHYVGMSHYPALEWNVGEGRFVAVQTGPPVVQPCIAWHQSFALYGKQCNCEIIYSVSYELLAEYAPAAWRQLTHDGRPAETGWTPPSTLFSPAHPEALAYLARVALSFLAIPDQLGEPVRYQIGEPWWWIGPDHVPCIYDPSAVAAYQRETERTPGPGIVDIRTSLNEEQTDYLDWAGLMLGRSTLFLRDEVRNTYPQCRTHLLFYAPQVLVSDSNASRLNVPQNWAYPAFDVLQLEDYDFVTDNRRASSRSAAMFVRDRLGYAPEQQHYLSGFVLLPGNDHQWSYIDEAAESACEAAVAEVFVWAYPQVVRDGCTHIWMEEGGSLDSFHDVLFPLELGLRAIGGPTFRTQILSTSSGFEQRNSDWRDARIQYEAGLGVRSEEDLRTLLSFFRARRGRAIGFRFRDPLDHSSAAEGEEVSALDQLLGQGDGKQTDFPLVKRYEGWTERRITRPVPSTVRVAVAGQELTHGWSLHGSHVSFDIAPAPSAEVTAGFYFDVPVRFATDQLEISLSSFRAGDVPSISLIEIRED